MTAEKEDRKKITDLIKKARSHHYSGQLKEAGELYRLIIENYQNGLKIPQAILAEAYNGLGSILAESNNSQEAINHFNKALSINSEYTEAHYNLATALAGLNFTNEAIIHYKQALDLRPDLAEAHNNLGALLLALNNKDEAITHFNKALSITPDYARAQRNLILANPDYSQISELEQIIADPKVTDNNAIEYHFTLGYLYDKHNEYARAFEHINKANTLKRKSINYSSKKQTVYVNELINTFSKDYFSENTFTGSDTELPVFIVGMPRSGTTLIEQIVSSHPLVYGAGELDLMRQIESEIMSDFPGEKQYPNCMTRFDGLKAEHYARKYINKIKNYSSKATYITDKMPNNFLRIGLIKLLLPNARIIHCERHALDTCLSIYSNYFTGGNLYSFDLREIGEYYLDYQKLMHHWFDIFQTEILNVQYEALVENQEQESRRILEYLGLEWNEQCLTFHENKRAVATTSQLQVRQPMYKNSVNKWKYYEEYLGPLLATIQL